MFIVVLLIILTVINPEITANKTTSALFSTVLTSTLLKSDFIVYFINIELGEYCENYTKLNYLNITNVFKRVNMSRLSLFSYSLTRS